MRDTELLANEFVFGPEVLVDVSLLALLLDHLLGMNDQSDSELVPAPRSNLHKTSSLKCLKLLGPSPSRPGALVTRSEGMGFSVPELYYTLPPVPG